MKEKKNKKIPKIQINGSKYIGPHGIVKIDGTKLLGPNRQDLVDVLSKSGKNIVLNIQV